MELGEFQSIKTPNQAPVGRKKTQNALKVVVRDEARQKKVPG